MMKRKTARILFNWLLVSAYCCAIFVLSSSASPRMLPPVVHADKIVHFAAFAVLGVLFYRAFGPLVPTIFRRVILSLLFATLFGIFIEIRQAYLPYRSAEAMDIAADVAGCLAGVGICLVAARLKPGGGRVP